MRSEFFVLLKPRYALDYSNVEKESSFVFFFKIYGQIRLESVKFKCALKCRDISHCVVTFCYSITDYVKIYNHNYKSIKKRVINRFNYNTNQPTRATKVHCSSFT